MLLMAAMASLSLANPTGFSAGAQCLKLGDFTSARKHFEHHLSLHPDHEQTIAVLAHLDELGVIGEEDEEEASFHETILTFPHPKQDWTNIVRLVTPSNPQDLTCDTSGHSVWSGAPAMLEWLGTASDVDVSLDGAHVLELGSGTGLVGCGIAKLGAKNVYCTDLPQIMPVLQANVAANEAEASASGCSLIAQPLVWGTKAGLSVVGDDSLDLIVATDVCYDEQLVPPLASTLKSLLSAHTGAVALLALTDLRHFGHDAPDYECLLGDLRHSGSLSVSQLASLDPAPVNARLAGEEVDVADAHRDHKIDVFKVCSLI